jgi:hypothetical protein
MKFLKEVELKLLKTLKDMLVGLLKKADWDAGICTKIQMVGIIHTGTLFTIISFLLLTNIIYRFDAYAGLPRQPKRLCL